MSYRLRACIRSHALYCLMVLLAGWLIGCQAAPAPTATPSPLLPTYTVTASPGPSATATMRMEATAALEATATLRPATPVSSRTPEPTVPPTARPTNTPRPTETNTPTPLPMLFTAAVIPGITEDTTVYDTWVDPDGRFWVATSRGVFVSETPNWQQMDDKSTLRFFGMDAAGRLWLGREDSAAYYPLSDADAQWQVFGVEAGWQPGVEATRFTPDFGYGETLVTDGLGRVWLVRNGELYQFEPASGRWTSYTAADLGFIAAIDNDDMQSRLLTDVALDSFGNVWVAHCASQGLLFTGEGARWYDGETWTGTPELAERCIFDIEVDSSGRVWLAGVWTLLYYDPTDGSWTVVELPPWPNPLIVVDLAFDSHDNPWLGVIKGTAGNWGSGARYHWTEGGWQSDYAEYEAIYGEESFSGVFGSTGSHVAFSADGDAWVCDWGTVYSFSPAHNGLFSQVTPFYPEGVCQVQVDGNGRVWLAQIGRGFALWYYDPE